MIQVIGCTSTSAYTRFPAHVEHITHAVTTARTQSWSRLHHSSTMITPTTVATRTYIHNITPQNVTLGRQITPPTGSHHSSVPPGLLCRGASVMVNSWKPQKRPDSVYIHVLCMWCQYHRQTTTASPQTPPPTGKPPQQRPQHHHPGWTTLGYRHTYKFRSIRTTTYWNVRGHRQIVSYDTMSHTSTHTQHAVMPKCPGQHLHMPIRRHTTAQWSQLQLQSPTDNV